MSPQFPLGCSGPFSHSQPSISCGIKPALVMQVNGGDACSSHRSNRGNVDVCMHSIDHVCEFASDVRKWGWRSISLAGSEGQRPHWGKWGRPCPPPCWTWAGSSSGCPPCSPSLCAHWTVPPAPASERNRNTRMLKGCFGQQSARRSITRKVREFIVQERNGLCSKKKSPTLSRIKIMGVKKQT